jgi:hypothetical protein
MDRASQVAYALWSVLKDKAEEVGAGVPKIKYPENPGDPALVVWADGPRGWARNAARGAKVYFPDNGTWEVVTPDHEGLVLTTVNSYTVSVGEEA